MWCGESNNDSQRAYIKQMKSVIKGLFAPENAIPVVQCMNSYESVHSVGIDVAKALVGNLWRAPYSPYEHQYQSWKALLQDKAEDGKPMSIVVTTGTGSGKTECFMMPLVHDLESNGKNGQIQAIFLYPLNALMEDQKERLEELLKGTSLTYTVYNGDLPEIEPDDDDQSPEAKKIRRQIAQIRGTYVDPETGETKHKYEKLVYTRRMVRKTPPNILLTNPTMLEYILLRGADSSLVNPFLKSLRWIAIDETHTYSGAGAAELAMLLRRVLLAFNVNATDIRFATSSATFGNADTPEKAKEEEDKLKEFISGITGTTKEQVRVIGGRRLGEDSIPVSVDSSRWRKIFEKDFIELNKLFTDSSEIEDKLQALDDMCQREEERCAASGSSTPDLKLKVHYFYRVPNNGLYVKLSEQSDGSFKIYSQNTVDDRNDSKIPLLELSRCKHCGEYVAVALVNIQDGTYEPLIGDDSDMFDIVEDETNDVEKKFAIIGLSNTHNLVGDGNVIFTHKDGKLIPALPGETAEDDWHIVGNLQYSCPYCNSKLARSKNSEDSQESDSAGNVDDRRLQKFRLSADFIARTIAPSVLDQLEKGSSADDNKIVLHDGQQYISFVDSRQAAAKSTLKQNLEEERMWFYTTIYHEMCRRKAESAKVISAINELKTEISGMEVGTDEWSEACSRLSALKAQVKDYMTWMNIAELI